MTIKSHSIDSIQARYQSQIIAIEGVISVSKGLYRNTNTCLKIGTSLPIEQIYPALPEGIFSTEIEVVLEFIDDEVSA